MGIKQLYNDNLLKLPNEYRDVSVMWNFDLNLAKKGRRTVIIRRVWLLRSTAVTMA